MIFVDFDDLAIRFSSSLSSLIGNYRVFVLFIGGDQRRCGNFFAWLDWCVRNRCFFIKNHLNFMYFFDNFLLNLPGQSPWPRCLIKLVPPPSKNPQRKRKTQTWFFLAFFNPKGKVWLFMEIYFTLFYRMGVGDAGIFGFLLMAGNSNFLQENGVSWEIR